MRVNWPICTALSLSDEELGERLRIPATPVAGLRQLGPDAASEVLGQQLKEIFIPSRQTNAVLRRILGAGQAHLYQHYADRSAYLRGVNRAESPLNATDAVCITGLPGVGKSAVGKALRRLLGETVAVEPGSGYPVVEFEFLWHVVVDARRTLKDLLKKPLNGRLYDSTKSDPDLVEAASRIAFRHGVALLVVDEWQFVTQSSSANALLTRLLHALRYIGVPVFYLANFSLCRRLKNRPKEDRDRLLNGPIIVTPESSDDPAVAELYEEYRVASEGALLAEPDRLAEQIHTYTRGVKRSRINLLTLAYRLSRERKVDEVASRDLEAAYNSAEFTCYREDARLLGEQDLTGREAHPDLWCPFNLPPSRQAKETQGAIAQEQEAVMVQAAISSMTSIERAGYRRLKAEPKPLPPTVQNQKRRPSATYANLLEGAARLRNTKGA
jgi:hypothetical protein